MDQKLLELLGILTHKTTKNKNNAELIKYRIETNQKQKHEDEQNKNGTEIIEKH